MGDVSRLERVETVLRKSREAFGTINHRAHKSSFAQEAVAGHGLLSFGRLTGVARFGCRCWLKLITPAQSEQ